MSAVQVLDQVRSLQVPAYESKTSILFQETNDYEEEDDVDANVDADIDIDGTRRHQQQNHRALIVRNVVSNICQQTKSLKDRDTNVDNLHKLSTCISTDNQKQQQQQQQHHHQLNGGSINAMDCKSSALEPVDAINKDCEPVDYEQEQEEQEEEEEEIICSAVHSLERDMPDFDYSHLVRELKDRVLKDCQLNVGLYDQKDVDKCQNDQWFIERFLLRQKLDLDKAFDMIKRTMRFRNESLAQSIRREDFPAEFYQVGGLFGYEEDRKGNKMLYIRLKIHRKMPEIQAVLQSFLYYNIKYLDELANGKGIAIVLDCTGAGLANADLDMLSYLISTLVNYFPKGMSYLLVHELPWMLKPFWHLAKGWLAEEHRQLIKFSNSRTIYEYIKQENLPDFMGGTCKRSYKTPPENCTTLEQAAKLWGIESEVAKKMLLKFAQYLPPETQAKCEKIIDDLYGGDTERQVECNEDTNSNDSNQENKGF